jgi:hypothetical protein
MYPRDCVRKWVRQWRKLTQDIARVANEASDYGKGVPLFLPHECPLGHLDAADEADTELLFGVGQPCGLCKMRK